MQDATERDANGKQEFQQQQQEHEFTDSEWNEALDKLKKLPAVERNQLQVIPFEFDGKKFVKIVGPDGGILRRLTETEVWLTISSVDQERPKGQLFDKAI